MDNLDVDADNTKKQAEINNFAWAERQYSSPDPLILEVFFANSDSLPVENLFMNDADLSKSERVDQSLENSFAATSDKKYHIIPKLAIIDQLKKQQNKRFYNFSQL